MTLDFHKLHPHFAAEASAVDLRGVHDDETLERIRAGMDEHAVLIFRDQAFSSEEQRDFAVRLDGELHRKTGIGVLQKSRFGDEALTDVSNVGEDGEVLEANSRKRQYGIANRLWHTDASFQDPRGRYSMLAALVLPPVSADTEFADMRAAYDTLADETKAGLEGLRVHHSIAYSRVTLGFEFSEEESDRLKGAIQPLVLSNPRTGRRSLYLASHASRILDRPVPDGRLLLRDLMEHATGPELVYRHSWRSGTSRSGTTAPRCTAPAPSTTPRTGGRCAASPLSTPAIRPGSHSPYRAYASVGTTGAPAGREMRVRRRAEAPSSRWCAVPRWRGARQRPRAADSGCGR